MSGQRVDLVEPTLGPSEQKPLTRAGLGLDQAHTRDRAGGPANLAGQGVHGFRKGLQLAPGSIGMVLTVAHISGVFHVQLQSSPRARALGIRGPDEPAQVIWDAPHREWLRTGSLYTDVRKRPSGAVNEG